MKQIELTLAEIPFPDTSIIERQVLADCVSNPESMPDFTGIVDESMFTDEKRKYIWKVLVWMFNNGQAIDLPTVIARTGKYYLDEVLQKGYDGATPYAALQHAVQLRSTETRRRAYQAALNLVQTATKPDTGELDVLSAAQQLTMDVQGERPMVSEISMSEVMDAVDAEVKENRKATAEGKQTRIPTGFRMLDNMTYGGWGPGQLIILAARPSIGKTAVMLQMAKSAARAGFPTTVFSLEMTKADLGKRLLFSTGRVTPREITTGYVNEVGYAPAKDELKTLPLYINDESRTLAGIISRITVSVIQERCKIAFIDYLGLITIDETGRMPLYQQVAKATRELKLLAMRQKIPIVLLCQLNRESVKEKDSNGKARAPELYDLRDSGAIEQDADIVLMLEQEKRISEDIREKPILNIWVRKNRQYEKDIKLPVKPNETYSAFTEIDERQPTQTPPEPTTETTEDTEDEPF